MCAPCMQRGGGDMSPLGFSPQTEKDQKRKSREKLTYIFSLNNASPYIETPHPTSPRLLCRQLYRRIGSAVQYTADRAGRGWVRCLYVRRRGAIRSQIDIYILWVTFCVEYRRLYVDPIQSCVLNITLAVLVQVKNYHSFSNRLKA